MTPRNHLLLIDPQNDFCDLPEAGLPAAGSRPALPVTGADADLQRVAVLIRAAGEALTDITITLDSHRRLDIAHPTFWRQADGSPVAPFTPVTGAQVRNGRFLPREPASLPRALAYLDALEARGRYTLMVWPVHCEIGSWGHQVHADVQAACEAWAERHGRTVRQVTKGENPWTEHYSAIQAEVPDVDDPCTQLNRALLEDLDRADRLWVAGEASSHCVRATVEDIVAHLDNAARLTLLSDCMSPVSGFADQHVAFLDDMRARGVHLATTDEALAALR